MTAPTNTFLTTAAIGNREDLTDIISRISPTETPVYSMAAKTKASATLHEWQTQDLATAASNAAVEGDDFSAPAVTPTVRLTNRTQISTKMVVVSGSQEAVDKAGRKGEMSYQMALKSLEWKRDVEFGLTQNDVTATSPRKSRGLLGWTVDNTSKDAGTTLASYTGNTAVTDSGTTRSFTEAQLKSVLQLVFIAGGKPDTITMGAAAKQTFSGFTGGATRNDASEDKKITAAVDVYVSDFGTLKAVPNLFQRTRDVFILESGKLAVAFLRPLHKKDIAPTGDAEKAMLIGEWTLENQNPKAHGAIYDIA
jgi:hypothetical protein